MALTDSIEHKLDRGLSDIRRTGRRVGRTTRSAARDLHDDVTDDLRGLVDELEDLLKTTATAISPRCASACNRWMKRAAHSTMRRAARPPGCAIRPNACRRSCKTTVANRRRRRRPRVRCGPAPARR